MSVKSSALLLQKSQFTFTRSLLVISLVVSPLFAAWPVHATTVFSNDYPDMDAVDCHNQFGSSSWCKDLNSDGDFNDPYEYDSTRGYVYRNCTDGAAYWVKKYTGVVISVSWGNAYNWDNAAPANQVYDGTTNNIEPGDIAQSDDGTVGHVGFVTSVNKNADGTVASFTTAELNEHSDGNYTGPGASETNVYSSRDAANKFIRNASTGYNWDHFIDVNGLGLGLNNESLNDSIALQGIQHIYTGAANGKIYETYWGGGNSLTTAEKATFANPVTAVSYQLYQGVQHMYAGTSGGEIYETYWGNGNSLTTWQLADLNTPIDSISSQITGNGLQHVYTGTDAGTVNETYWGGGNSLTTWQLASLGSPIKSLSSLVTGSGSVQHVFSATADGKIRETYWGGGNSLTTWQVANLVDSVNSIDVKLTGTGLLHVFSGTSAGNIYETYWGDGNSLTTALKASFGTPVNSISALFYNGVAHIYTGTNAGTVYETYWGNGNSLTTWQVANVGTAVAKISAQITGNGLQHVYTATADGRLRETYWGDGNSLTTWQTADIGSMVNGMATIVT